MTGKELREALCAGRRVYATSILSPSPLWPGALRETGIDFVFLDTEHIPQDRHTLSWMCAAYKAVGLPPVVRIPNPDPFEAAKVLDGGASGVIVPYLERPEDLLAVMGAVKLRPLKGDRLADALRDIHTLEPKLRAYLEKRNENNVLIANIESVPAMERLDEILAVPGLDAVLIGPHDLTCSLGIPEEYQAPEFDRAVREIFRKARARGVGAGLHYFWEGDTLETEWAKAGGNLIMHSSDISLFTQTLRRDIAGIRRALGEEATPTGGEAIIV